MGADLASWYDTITSVRDVQNHETLAYRQIWYETLLLAHNVGNATDLVTPYMRTVLGFIGINEVDFIYAEGMGMGPEAQAKGIEQAKEQLETLAY